MYLIVIKYKINKDYGKSKRTTWLKVKTLRSESLWSLQWSRPMLWEWESEWVREHCAEVSSFKIKTRTLFLLRDLRSLMKGAGPNALKHITWLTWKITQCCLKSTERLLWITAQRKHKDGCESSSRFTLQSPSSTLTQEILGKSVSSQILLGLPWTMLQKHLNWFH